MDFITFSNEELDKALTIRDYEECPNCGEEHKVEYPINTRTGEISKLLSFVNCPGNETPYLVGVNGKRV